METELLYVTKKFRKKFVMNFDLVCKKPPLDFEIQYLGKQVTATLYYLADEGRMLKVSSVFDINDVKGNKTRYSNNVKVSGK